jgi:hypothetical protein
MTRSRDRLRRIVGAPRSATGGKFNPPLADPVWRTHCRVSSAIDDRFSKLSRRGDFDATEKSLIAIREGLGSVMPYKASSPRSRHE